MLTTPSRRMLTVSSAPPISERPSRVLVVSPDVSRQSELLALLEGDGYEALALADADELLRVVAEFEPDLVMLDLEQRQGRGIEICGDLKAVDPKRHLPTVLLCFGKVDEHTVAAGLMAGADDFILDTTRLAELSARVRAQLRVKRYVDALQRVRSERDLLRRDAEVDALTGLSNRRALERSANDRVDRRERFGALFIDADHFKRINDRHGHLVGDRVLVAIADTLRAGLRPGDLVSRYGGEEFVALVAGAGPEAARLVAERLRRAIASIESMRPGPSGVSVSIGTAVFDPRSSDDAQSVLRRADLALYAAKRAGRDQVVMYSSECEKALPDPERCSQEPRNSLDRSEPPALDSGGMR